MKKTILWAMLAMLLPVTQAWGGAGHSYAKLQAKVSNQSSGAGKVYASNDGTEDTYKDDVTSGQLQSADDVFSGFGTFFAFAKPNDGYEFDYWSYDADNEIRSSETANTSLPVNFGTEKNTTNTRVIYAHFKEGKYAPYTVTFEQPESGSYTVSAKVGPNGTVESQTASAKNGVEYKDVGKMLCTTLTASPGDGALLGWYTKASDGTKTYISTDTTISRNFTSNATVGVEICPKNEFAKVATLGELQSAFADKRVVEIPENVGIDANGGAVTVPAGKKLIINGSLTNVKFDCLGSYENNGTLTKVVATVESNYYLNISDAVTAWTAKTTLTLCDNATLSDVITLPSDTYRTLNLSKYTLTAASGKNAIYISSAPNNSSSSVMCLDVCGDASSGGGIYASEQSCIQYDTTVANGVSDRPLVRIYGGLFRGKYGIYITSVGNKRAPVVQFFGGVFNCTGNDFYFARAQVEFQGGTFMGAAGYAGVDSTSCMQFYGGAKFKNLPTCSSASDMANAGKWRINYAEILKTSDGYYQLLSAAPATFAAKAAWSKTGFPTTSGFLYYGNVDEAFASGQKNITLGPNTVYSKDLMGAYIIDATAEKADFTGNVTLTTAAEVFKITLPADRKFGGTVTPYGGKQLTVSASLTGGNIVYTYATKADAVSESEAEAVVGGVYYKTFYDATYAVDGTKDKTIKLLKDVGEAVFMSRGTDASNDGITRVTVDFNGRTMTLSDIEFAGGANYYITFIDSSDAKTGAFTNGSVGLRQIGIRHYLNGDYANYGSLYICSKGGIWSEDPTYNNIADGKVILCVSPGYKAEKAGSSDWSMDTWKVVPEEYSVSYVLDGGTNDGDNPAKYTIESPAITLADPTKDGSEFEGWYSDADLTQLATGIAAGSTGDKTFYAKWALAQVTIKIPSVEHATAMVYTNGVEATLTDGSITVTPGVSVRVVYTAEKHYAPYMVEKTIDGVKAGDAIDVSDLTFAESTLWIDWAADAFAAEDDNAISIATADQLALLAKRTNEGETFADYTITLAADIALTGKTWTPIGTKEHPFAGVFDGANKTVSGLTVSSSANAGLFGYVKGTANTEYAKLGDIWADNALDEANIAEAKYTAVVKNLKVSGCNVAASGKFAGAVVGEAYNAYLCNLTLESGRVKADKYAGGIAGTIQGSVLKAATNLCGSIDATTYHAAGIVAGAGYTAGYGPNAVIGCANRADLTLTFAGSGGSGAGIVAYASPGASNGTAVIGCANVGNLDAAKCTGTSQMAGVVGCGQGVSIVANCSNGGTINVTGAAQTVGGVVAAMTGGTLDYRRGVYNCSNAGDVSGNATYVAGVVAAIDTATGSTPAVDGCTNKGTVTNTKTPAMASTILCNVYGGAVTLKNMTFADEAALSDALPADAQNYTAEVVIDGSVAVTDKSGVLNLGKVRTVKGPAGICSAFYYPLGVTGVSGDNHSFNAYLPGATLTIPAGATLESVTGWLCSDDMGFENNGTFGGALVIAGANAKLVNNGTVQPNGGNTFIFQGADASLVNKGTFADGYYMYVEADGVTFENSGTLCGATVRTEGSLSISSGDYTADLATEGTGAICLTGGTYAYNPNAAWLGVGYETQDLQNGMWEVKPIEYAINYVDKDYGTERSFAADTHPITYTVLDEVTLVPLAVPDNLRGKEFFEGWFDAETNGNVVAKIEKGTTGPKTLYARWEGGISVPVKETDGQSQSTTADIVIPKSYIINNTVNAPEGKRVTKASLETTVGQERAKQIAKEDTTVTSNELTLVENYVLGLNPKKVESVPVVVPVQTAADTTEETGLTLDVGNIEVNNDAGAKVTYVLETSEKSDFTDKTDVKEQVDNKVFENIKLPTSGVKYYRVNIKVGK